MDASDACPDEPGPAHDSPRLNGCRIRVSIGHTNPPPPPVVRFEGDSAGPSSSSAAELDAAAAIMKDRPEIKLVRIEGHDDRRAHFRVEVTEQGATEAEVGCGPSREAGLL